MNYWERISTNSMIERPSEYETHPSYPALINLKERRKFLLRRTYMRLGFYLSINIPNFTPGGFRITKKENLKGSPL